MNFIISKEEYLSAMAAWNKISNRTATDHIFYNALRGLDLKRGFSPIQSENKLANGMTPWQSFDNAKRDAEWLLRDTAKSSSKYDTPERIAKREAEQKERFETLSKKFGVTFTSELIALLMESFK